jgi:NAD(P)-dependent dehydrogenase (short-subunit alcohol dehydrogenase family)
MQELGGQVAVVTGAASGIGSGIARAAAARGMRLVLADVDDAGVAKVADTLREDGADVVVTRTDVRRADELDALAQTALDAYGAVHLVCNNAGVLVGGHAWERTDDDWRWVIDVNLFGVVNGLRTFVPILIDQGQPAHIVNTASIGGLMVGPYLSPYIVSKHAVVVLTESVFHELAALDAPVHISVLCPGPIATGITDSERIRPNDRARTAALRTPAEKSFDEMLRTGVSAGMPPDQVGEIVLEGVRNERFWIFTHPVPADSIRARAESIVAGADPGYAAEMAEDMLDGD